MTLGERRIRISFNPSEISLVDIIKSKSAELIDLCEREKPKADAEGGRLWELAMTAYEEAAIWAVKAATAAK